MRTKRALVRPRSARSNGSPPANVRIDGRDLVAGRGVDGAPARARAVRRAAAGRARKGLPRDAVLADAHVGELGRRPRRVAARPERVLEDDEVRARSVDDCIRLEGEDDLSLEAERHDVEAARLRAEAGGRTKDDRGHRREPEARAVAIRRAHYLRHEAVGADHASVRPREAAVDATWLASGSGASKKPASPREMGGAASADDDEGSEEQARAAVAQPSATHTRLRISRFGLLPAWLARG